MACGVPVVASAVGGMLDTVIHGGTGLHVPPRDPPALAMALRRLLDDPDLCRHMGENGRLQAVRNYGWETVAARTLDAYRSVIERVPVTTPASDSQAQMVTP
jgi:glycosyltransferase involved in cell wall biosynthesis